MVESVHVLGLLHIALPCIVAFSLAMVCLYVLLVIHLCPSSSPSGQACVRFDDCVGVWPCAFGHATLRSKKAFLFYGFPGFVCAEPRERIFVYDFL